MCSIFISDYLTGRTESTMRPFRERADETGSGRAIASNKLKRRERRAAENAKRQSQSADGKSEARLPTPHFPHHTLYRSAPSAFEKRLI
jgi:hypothetical protein